MISVFSAGQYEDAIVGNSTGSTGDWNGDGDFESGDLIAAFSDGGYEARPARRSGRRPGALHHPTHPRGRPPLLALRVEK